MKLIDTDILIDHFHGNAAALTLMSHLAETETNLAISVVTMTEILGGMRPGEEARTEQLLQLFNVIPVSEAIGRAAAVYLRLFRRSHRIDFGDALVAATTLVYNAELFTRNEKHYPMPDIKVVIPYTRGQQ